MKLDFFSKYFRKFSNIKIRENPSSGRGVDACRQMDRHDEANSCFHNFASAPKIHN